MVLMDQMVYGSIFPPRITNPQKLFKPKKPKTLGGFQVPFVQSFVSILVKELKYFFEAALFD